MSAQFLAIAVLLTSICCGCDIRNGASSAPESVAEMPTLHGPVTFELENGELRQQESPETFPIPNLERRENLKSGDIVKLMFHFTTGSDSMIERMWVVVKECNQECYVGTLDNDPYCTDQICSGMEVRFQPRHVIDIWADEEHRKVEGAKRP